MYDDTYTLDPSEAKNKVGKIPNRVYRMYSGFQNSFNSISTNVAGHDKAEATEFTITYSGPASNQTVNLKIGATSYSSNAEAWSGVLTYPISKAVSGSNTISLNASELTTVTNWIKAGLTIYFGAVINNEHNDASYFYISNVVVRYKKRFEVVVSIDRHYDENSVVSLNGQPIVGTGGTLKFDELSTVNIAVSIQVNYNSQPYVFSSMSLSGQTITSTSYSFAISADRTVSLTYVAARSITLDNRANYSANPSERIEGSTITIKNSGSNYSTATAGQTKYLPQNANMSFTTNHGNYGEDLNFKGQGYRIKHRDWNESLAEFKLEKFQTITDNSSFTAWYHELRPATIKLSLDGILQNNIPLQFKDPWRVVNGAQPGNWDTYNSGANLGIGNDGSTIVGVMQNVIYDQFNPNNAHYRVKADQFKTLNGSNAKFISWSTTNAQAYLPEATESPIKFNASGATVTAVYKGHLRTGRPDLADAKNQRRLVSNGNYWVMVYESMGDVWITISSDGGATWGAEQRLNTNVGQASNPTISNPIGVPMTPEDTKYAIVCWVENGSSVHVQTLRIYSYWTPGVVDFVWTQLPGYQNSTNHKILGEYPFLAPYAKSTARPSVSLLTSGNNIIATVAYEKNTNGIAVLQLLFEGTGGKLKISKMFQWCEPELFTGEISLHTNQIIVLLSSVTLRRSVFREKHSCTT